MLDIRTIMEELESLQFDAENSGDEADYWRCWGAIYALQWVIEENCYTRPLDGAG